MQLDRPDGKPDDCVAWGSDVAAQMLRRFGIPYVSLNPGASYRGLHDSVVNHLGNETPGMLLCLHEDHAVSIAHGYAKATGEPMACFLHSNVGLMHGMMSLYNAWCDRVPMLVLGATGPLDSAKRRPWIDWIHTTRDQGGLIRSFIKYDDLPASPEALVEAMCRANIATRTAPCAPIYICLDAGLQEAALDKVPHWPDLARFTPPEPARPPGAVVAAAAAMLDKAQRPVILAGRGKRTREAWLARIELAERLGACVMTDLKSGSSFPTDHPAHVIAPANNIGKAARAVLGDADVILALDWIDLGGTVRPIGDGPAVTAKIISASLDHTLHNGFNMDHQILAPVDVPIAAVPDAVVADLLAALGPGTRKPWHERIVAKPKARGDGAVTMEHVTATLRTAFNDPDSVSFVSLGRGWPVDLWPFTDPLSYIGKDGGGGIGSGPGLSVGAALALHDKGRWPVAMCGDGDFIMGNTALWTAVRHRIPLLVLINNNRSYFNDELHQETMARRRGRNPKNRWIGQRLADPEVNIAKLAEGQGAVGIGPIERAADVQAAIERGVAVLKGGGVCVIDFHIAPSAERLAAAVEARGMDV
jgi:thiamine pyrophosphate-dependent acetolactate synthase large subunit-like protein